MILLPLIPALILVLMYGMVIFTLRGALLPSILDDEPDDFYYTSSRRWGGRERGDMDDYEEDDGFDYEDPSLNLSKKNMDKGATAKEDVFIFFVNALRNILRMWL